MELWPISYHETSVAANLTGEHSKAPSGSKVLRDIRFVPMLFDDDDGSLRRTGWLPEAPWRRQWRIDARPNKKLFDDGDEICFKAPWRRQWRFEVGPNKKFTTTMGFASKLLDDGNGGLRLDQIKSSSTPMMGFVRSFSTTVTTIRGPNQKFAPKFFDDSDDDSYVRSCAFINVSKNKHSSKISQWLIENIN